MGFLSSIGTWLLKIFLGGLFNKVMTQIEDAAEHTRESAELHAETTEEAAKAEIDIVKKQVEVERAYKEAAKPVDDPFNVDRWNSGK